MSEIGATPRISMGGWSVVSFRAKEMQFTSCGLCVRERSCALLLIVNCKLSLDQGEFVKASSVAMGGLELIKVTGGFVTPNCPK